MMDGKSSSNQQLQQRWLAPSQKFGESCGKVILIGEHAAVAGHPAIALPMKSQWLRVRFCAPEFSSARKLLEWSSCWSLVMENRVITLSENEKVRLTRTLELALKMLTQESLNLSTFAPQPIEIESCLPLGAGMGGSAALSAALVRAVAHALEIELSRAQISKFANELDGIFHGRASGLDAATVVSDSIIRFQKGMEIAPVRNKTGFWLLLIDTGDRTPTRHMVERVASLRAREPEMVERCFLSLADLARACENSLRGGDIPMLGTCLNQAHAYLRELCVSTRALDDCVTHLRDAGAVGAKLTGGGGGGLALGLFAHKPQVPFHKSWEFASHFLTFVPADKNS